MYLNSLHKKNDVFTRYAPGSWQHIIFSEFTTSMESATRPFPCIFGVQGYKADQLRYVFQDEIVVSDLAKALAEFIKSARDFGPNTSLVVFTRPQSIDSLEAYENQFWHILKQLRAHDTQPWPAGIPDEIDSTHWEFCFAGEPVFVVCNTPAHLLRQSRRASSFMLTFQPRWVFEKILGTERAAQKAFSSVRDRLASYDFIPLSPALGRYGDPGVLEHQQYFLDEENRPGRCPFHSLQDKAEPPQIEKTCARGLQPENA